MLREDYNRDTRPPEEWSICLGHAEGQSHAKNLYLCLLSIIILSYRPAGAVKDISGKENQETKKESLCKYLKADAVTRYLYFHNSYSEHVTPMVQSTSRRLYGPTQGTDA